jgi:GGDEF domain-containing protein
MPPSAELEARRLQKTLQLLLDGLGAGVVVLDVKERRTLAAELSRLRRNIAGAPEPNQFAKEVLSLLASYNRRIERRFQQAITTLPEIVSGLTDSLEAIRKSNGELTKSLERIAGGIPAAKDLTELETFRQQLRHFADRMVLESTHQNARVHEVICGVIQHYRQAMETADQDACDAVSPQIPSHAEDPLTGFPGPERVRHELESLAGNRLAQVAIFHLDRLRLIEERFGPAGCDQFLMYFSRALAWHLNPPNAVFRWAQAVFIGSVADPESFDADKDLQGLRSGRDLCELDVNGRFALVPVSFRYRALPVFGQVPDAIVKQIEEFVASSEAGP